MIGNQLALIRREIWEHRSIYVTPAAIAVIVTLGTLAMLLFAGGFAKELDVAIFGAQNLAGDAERQVALTGFFVGTSWLFLFAACDPDRFLHARLAVCRAQGQEHPVLALFADNRRRNRAVEVADRTGHHPAGCSARHYRHAHRQPHRYQSLGQCQRRRRRPSDLGIGATAGQLDVSAGGYPGKRYMDVAVYRLVPVCVSIYQAFAAADGIHAPGCDSSRSS